MTKIAIGVDVGGSHVSCMAYDLVKKELLPNTLAETDLDNHGQPNEIIAAWGGVIKKTIETVGIDNVKGVGFAMGGNISRAHHLFGDSLNTYLEKNNLKINIAVSELKETAAFIGSATLVDDTFYGSVWPVLHKM